jgi:hypothetical protein
MLSSRSDAVIVPNKLFIYPLILGAGSHEYSGESTERIKQEGMWVGHQVTPDSLGPTKGNFRVTMKVSRLYPRDTCASHLGSG